MAARRGGRRPRLWLEELEPRWLLSADIVPFAVPEAPFPESALHESIVDVLHAGDPAIAAPVVPGRIELVFVDARVPDHEQLVADLAGQNDGWRRLEVIVLDPERDGIAQVTEALASRLQLDAVHFISHGADGAVQLGASWLDAGAVAANEATVADWGQSLKAHGDLLFYGCDVAASATGEAFLARLASLTQADVAASADFTGADALGGDWRLEFTLGVIESDVILSAHAQAGWIGLLATQTLDWDLVANGTLLPAWSTASTAPHTYTVGGGDVAISFTGDTGKINTGPIVDQFNEGGTAQEYALHVGLDLDDGVQQVVWTIDFSHPNGVSNVGFTIFDIDVGGFVDSVTVTSDKGDPTVTGSANNFVSGNTVTGTVSTPQTGATSGNANATFFFGQSGISQITIVYKHGAVTDPTQQGISLHDITFDPTPAASDRNVAPDEDAVHTFAASDFGFSDVDGDTLQQVRITALETAGDLEWNGVDVALNQVIDVADLGLLTFTPAPDANGVPYASFRFQVSDGASFSVSDYSMTVNVNAVPDTVNDAVSVNEDSAVVVNVLTNDNLEDVTRTLTGVSAPANGGVVFNASGSVAYTPNADWNGTEVLTYTVTAGGVTETGTLTITVDPLNDEPSFTLAGSQSVNEDAAAQTVVGFAAGAPGGGPDEAGQTLTYAVSNDNNALFAVQPSVAANGTLTYTPAADAYGSATVSVYVTDSGGTANVGDDDTSPSQTFTITLAPVADTPSVTSAATLEDVQTTGGLVITRNPADGAEITHYKITAISGGTLFLNDGTTVVTSSTFVTEAQGTLGLRFTPAANSVVAGSFDVQASVAGDDAGLGGSAVTATIAMTPVNDVPSFVLAGNQAVNEDAGAQLVAVFAVGSPGGGPDEAGQALTYAVSNDNNALFAVQPALAPDGTLSYTPVADASGSATVAVSLMDNGGTLNGGIDTTAGQTFTISVTPVADAPALTVSPAARDEDTAIPIAIAASLVDTDGSETLAVTVSTIPGGATLSDGANSFTSSAGSQSVVVTGWNFAALTVTPPLNSDTDFTLGVSATATEGANGAVATTNALLAVDVVPVNDAPVLATNAGLTVDEGAAAILTPAMLLVIDVDNTAAQLVYTATTPPANGRLERVAAPGVAIASFTQDDLDNGRIRYVHDGSESIADGFTFAVSDGAGGAIGATPFAITVNPVNDAPALTVNRLAITDSQTVTLTPADLDAVDPDNPPADLTFSVSGVVYGRFELASAPGVVVTTFTYSQLAAGEVRFVHAGGNQVPAYSVTPSDLALAGGTTAAQITFIPASDPGDGSVLLKPANTVIDDPLAVLALREPLVSDGSSLAFPQVNAPIPIPRDLESFGILAPPSEPEFMPVRAAARAGPSDGFAKTDPNVETESMELFRLPGPAIDAQLDKLDFGGPQSRSSIEVLMGMVKMGGVALSVGAVWWATRTAGLLASALSSLPAWRNFDPLPVLGRDEFEEDDWVQEFDKHATAETEEEEKLVGRRFSNAETQPIDLAELRRSIARE